MSRFETNDSNLLSTALGAGGPFAIAYDSGICMGLGEKGIDLRTDDGPIIGTSGGAWAAGFIVENMTEEEVEAIPKVKFPNREKDYLLNMGDQVFDDARSTRVGAVGLRLPSLTNWLPEIEVVSSNEATLGQKAALTSAIPLGYRSVKVNGNRYVDGGATLSFTHADLAQRADHLLVVAALAKHFRPSLGPVKLPLMGRQLEMRAYYEMSQWKKMHGGQAHLIRPNRAIGGLVEHLSDLFDKKISRRAYDMAIEQAHQLVEERPSLAALAIKMTQRRSGNSPKSA
jgi:predicted acylesterase/phospholipase RssA